MSYLPPSGPPPPGVPPPPGNPPSPVGDPPSPGNVPSPRWPEPPVPSQPSSQTHDWGAPAGLPPRPANPPSIGGPERVQSRRPVPKPAFFVVLGVFAVGVIAAGAFLFLGGDDGGGEEAAEEEEESPEDAVHALFTAAKSGDCEAAVAVATESFFGVSSREEALTACQGFVDSQAPGWVDDYTVASVQLSAEQETTATVAVGLSPGPGSQAPPGWIIDLVRGEDEVWLVDAAEISTTSDVPAEDTEGQEPSETDDPGSGVGPDGANQPAPPPTGADAGMDDLAQECFQGEMVACDELFAATYDEEHPEQSEYPDHAGYGYSCGGRFEGEVKEACQDLVPEPPAA